MGMQLPLEEHTAHFSLWDVYIFCPEVLPAGRGYGYVAASCFRTRAGCFLRGHLSRAHVLPVGGECTDEVLERGYDSLSDDDEDDRGQEYSCEGEP